MELLLKSENRETKGFICPGHVSVIIGTEAYTPFSEKYNMPCVITGFEAIDMIIANKVGNDLGFGKLHL